MGRVNASSEAKYGLEIATAFALPVRSGSIDMLVNNYMFDLIPHADMNRVIDEFWRSLRAGGRLILVNMTRGESPASSLYEHIYRISPRAMGGCRGVNMAGRLRERRFTVETREYHQQLPFPSEGIVARKSG
jgi:ubiquinone/menaquinone biosynthesis C-methylase UbiE